MIGFFLWLAIALARAFYLQVLSPVESMVSVRTEKIQAQRGKIYDKKGYLLATNRKKFILYLDKNKTSKPEAFVKDLSEILELDEATISARISRYKVWVPISRNVSLEKRKKLEERLDEKALVFEERFERFYPESSLSAYLTGFVGKDKNGYPKGYFGLEGFYDNILKGLEGIFKTERGGRGIPLLFGTQEIIEPEDGADLYLGIEKGIQQIVKKRLKDAVERYGASMGCVLVAKVESMQILSLSCLPDYDPNSYWEASPEAYVNPAISAVFEPGSIFKPLIVAAALQEGKIKPGDKVLEDAPVRIADSVIRTWDNKYEGEISITRVLQRSSNVGMVRIGERLGKENIFKYLKSYGFYEKTGIDLQGEAKAVIKPERDWYPVDFATVTFGQGIAITPIQMLTAFAAVVNDGRLMKPYVVEKIVQSDKEQKIEPMEKRKILSDKTSRIIRQMLIKVVEGGEVKWDIPAGYTFGGKTGTAQIAVEGKYDPEKTFASFIGFFPAENPKIIAMTMLKEPTASPWGSETAAPLFFQIARDIIIYYNITAE